MSAFSTSYSGIVRALVSEIGIVTGVSAAATEVVKCKALWDTGAVYSVISLGDFTITNKGATRFAFRIPSEGIPA